MGAANQNDCGRSRDMIQQLGQLGRRIAFAVHLHAWIGAAAGMGHDIGPGDICRRKPFCDSYFRCGGHGQIGPGMNWPPGERADELEVNFAFMRLGVNGQPQVIAKAAPQAVEAGAKRDA